MVLFHHIYTVIKGRVLPPVISESRVSDHLEKIVTLIFLIPLEKKKTYNIKSYNQIYI